MMTRTKMMTRLDVVFTRIRLWMMKLRLRSQKRQLRLKTVPAPDPKRCAETPVQLSHRYRSLNYATT